MKRPPSRVWLWFWGRKRRGYPGLLTALVVLAVAGAITLRTGAGYLLAYWLGVALIALLALLTLGALGAALLGVLRPRGRR